MKYLPWIVCGLVAMAYPFGDYLPALVPGTDWGVVGIALAPFKHASLSHLLANLLPLAYLLWLLRRDPWPYVLGGLVFIVLFSGTFVWLEGRSAIHEGASGLALGLLAMLAMRQGFEADVTCSALVATVIALEMNQQLDVSWELHAGGFVAGHLYAFMALRWHMYKESDNDHQSSSAAPTSCPAKCRGSSGQNQPSTRRRSDP